MPEPEWRQIYHVTLISLSLSLIRSVVYATHTRVHTHTPVDEYTLAAVTGRVSLADVRASR